MEGGGPQLLGLLIIISMRLSERFDEIASFLRTCPLTVSRTVLMGGGGLHVYSNRTTEGVEGVWNIPEGKGQSWANLLNFRCKIASFEAILRLKTHFNLTLFC